MKIDHNEHDLEAKQVILQNIEQYGCHLSLIEENDYLPAFVYSIGLFEKFNHPEIICFGLKTDVLASVINHAKDLVMQGETLEAGKLYKGFLEGYEIQFIPVDKEYYQNYLGYGGWFYDMSFEFPALQLVWPDKQSLFPWQEGFNPDWRFRQPLLDRNTDFKFYEERNLGVYTTQQVMDGASIIYVYHNEDGDWQFHSEIDPDPKDGRLISLEEITKLDPTINEIYFLQYGWNAWRSSIHDDWQYAEDKNRE